MIMLRRYPLINIVAIWEVEKEMSLKGNQEIPELIWLLKNILKILWINSLYQNKYFYCELKKNFSENFCLIYI